MEQLSVGHNNLQQLVAQHPQLAPDLKSRLEFVLLLGKAQAPDPCTETVSCEASPPEFWFDDSLQLAINRKVTRTGGSRFGGEKSIEVIELIRIPKKAAARYESAAEMMADLQLSLQREPVKTWLGRKFSRSLGWISRKPVAGLLLLLVLAASLVSAGVVLGWMFGTAA